MENLKLSSSLCFLYNTDFLFNYSLLNTKLNFIILPQINAKIHEQNIKILNNDIVNFEYCYNGMKVVG